MTDLTRGEKIRLTGIRTHGSEEAWRAYMSSIGKMGGSTKGKPKGFAVNREVARRAGMIGGRISRRRAK
jgi:hypothetical protein